MKKTKIICTIGPSNKNRKMLKNLILNGMDIARINTSHSSNDEITEILKNIRDISAKYGVYTAIMLDLQGPKIRIGKLERDIKLKNNQNVIFYVKNDLNIDKSNNELLIKVDYEKLLQDIKEKNSIFIDDGLIECRITGINKKNGYARAVVVKGGVLKSHKGINLPGVTLSVDSITEKDLNFLNFGLEHQVDFIAQSFVRNENDIRLIKQIIKDEGKHAMVVAKIEKHEAINNFDNILKASDAIMIARGDLGVEIDEEDVPGVQKSIIKKCNIVGKPVITATQMLDSMIRNPRPTRAEVSDVANAILDGSDAVMLSGETAVGKYPLESLGMMVKIINKTEEMLDYSDILQKKFIVKQHTVTEAISFAACEIANVLNAKAIITFTQSGITARQVSKNRPSSLIIGVSPHDYIVRQLMMSWGVIPFKIKFTDNIDINKMFERVVELVKSLSYIESGDKILLTGGLNKPGSTNFISVKEV